MKRPEERNKLARATCVTKEIDRGRETTEYEGETLLRAYPPAIAGRCRATSPITHTRRRVVANGRDKFRLSIIEKKRWSVLKRSEECKKLARGQQDAADRSRPMHRGWRRGRERMKKRGAWQEDGNERRRRRRREKNQRRGSARGRTVVEKMRRSDGDVGRRQSGRERKKEKRGSKSKREGRGEEKEKKWGRQKEARVIGRRGRTSEGEHLPRPAAVHRLAAAADVPRGPKKIARKKERAGRRTTRIMNTYACRGGTSFTARTVRSGGDR